MSDVREASWYEIALTHSQIVKIFVVLLLCLVGAFFSGVWIGRDAVNAVETVAGPMAADAAVEPAADGEEIAQLNFFTDDEVVATGTATPAEAGSGAEPQPAIREPGVNTTLVDDLAATERAPKAAAPPPVQIARNEPDAPVVVTRETPAATSPATPANGELVVQVFSSNDPTQARRVLGRLAEGGHPAYLSPVEVSGRTMYRVRIGPYAERSAAERVAETVRRAFKLDTWITQKST